MGILPLPLLSLTRRICSLTCIIFGRTTGLLAAVLGRDILSVPYCQKKRDVLRGKDSYNKIYNMVGCINNSDDWDQMLCSPTGIASSYYYSSSTLPQWFLWSCGYLRDITYICLEILCWCNLDIPKILQRRSKRWWKSWKQARLPLLELFKAQ